MTTPPPFPDPVPWVEEPPHRNALQKALAPIAAAGAFVLKFGALVFKIKFLGLAISMLVSILGYTLLFGWTFAVGLVLLVLVHELGHLVVMRARGFQTGLPVFVPFFGAFVKGQKQDATAYDQAWASLSGPIFGGVAAAAVVGLGEVYSSDFLNALGWFGLYLTVLNLSPIAFLDGGVPGAALTKGELIGFIVVLAALLGTVTSAAVPVLLATSAYRLYKTWHGRQVLLMPSQQRVVVVATYFVVIALSLLVMHDHQPVARHL